MFIEQESQHRVVLWLDKWKRLTIEFDDLWARKEELMFLPDIDPVSDDKVVPILRIPVRIGRSRY